MLAAQGLMGVEIVQGTRFSIAQTRLHPRTGGRPLPAGAGHRKQGMSVKGIWQECGISRAPNSDHSPTCQTF